MRQLRLERPFGSDVSTESRQPNRTAVFVLDGNGVPNEEARFGSPELQRTFTGGAGLHFAVRVGQERAPAVALGGLLDQLNPLPPDELIPGGMGHSSQRLVAERN